MKKRELLRQINALELENSSMRGIVESANQTMGKLWSIVDPEHNNSLAWTLPDVLKARMDELRRLRATRQDTPAWVWEAEVERFQRHAKNWREACEKAEKGMLKLQAELDAMRPVVEAVGEWMDSETDPDDVLVAAWNVYSGSPTSDESDDLDDAHGALGYVVQRASEPLPVSLDSEANRMALDAGAIDTGLPIRPGDVWRHVHYGERTMVEPDGPNAWVTKSVLHGNTRTIYMYSNAAERGEWSFVRRAVDTGLPIRLGDVWRHERMGEREVRGSWGAYGWRMGPDSVGGSDVYMTETELEKWTFVRRGATDD